MRDVFLILNVAIPPSPNFLLPHQWAYFGF